MTTSGDEALEKARTLFDAGVEIVYLTVEDDQTILVSAEPPDHPGTFVSTRSIEEVRRFLRDVKVDRTP
jgi:hypothetical protein